ncbi:MAG TPA: DUF4239 domain-containing protein [Thermoanaerobaculia bacterium]|nr:DUF4239 domain-containing protein [Thermoanaerobaculia bacterium]
MLPAVPIAAALFVGMLACLELGRRLGRRRIAADPTGAMAGLGALDGAVFGLYGLLMAFTFSGAPARLDTRRQMIAQEANAIRTAWLRIDLLPADAQPELRRLFRAYLDARIDATRGKNFETARAEASRTETLQQDIWSAAVAASRSSPNPETRTLFLPSVNAMIDVTTTRLMLARSHPPKIVFALLFVLALLCAALAGFGMAGSARRAWLHILSFAMITVVTVYTILDIEYPRTGLIRMDAYDQVMRELRSFMD